MNQPLKLRTQQQQKFCRVVHGRDEIAALAGHIILQCQSGNAVHGAVNLRFKFFQFTGKQSLGPEHGKKLLLRLIMEFMLPGPSEEGLLEYRRYEMNSCPLKPSAYISLREQCFLSPSKHAILCARSIV